MSHAISIDGSGKVSGVELNSLDYPKDECYFDSNESYDESFSRAEPLQMVSNLAAGGTDRSVAAAKSTLHSFLQTVPHLFTLTADQVGTLDVMVREYGEMNLIVEEGVILEHVYVLASGTVEVMNSKRGLKRAFGHRRIGTITAPNVFGIDDAVLEIPTEFSYHASSKTTLLLIPKEQFTELFAQSAIFANNVSSRILQTLPAFSVFQDFCRSLFGLSSASYDGTHRSQAEGYRLSLGGLVDIYHRTGTVFHRLIHSNEIDAEALHYCTRRLPSNITQTYIIFLTSVLPEFISNEFLADAATNARAGATPMTVAVDTGKRRRCAWTFGGGAQTAVITRDGFTDTIDFVSNLCMLTVEARKISRRLRQLVSPSAAEILRDALVRQSAGEDVSYVLDDLLPFSDSEVATLRETWGTEVLAELYRVLLHHEEYVVHMEPTSTRRFAQDPYMSWSLTLLRHIRSALGLLDSEDDLPTNIVIDVLFSPNRTLKNLFCSMSSDLKDLIADDTGLKDSLRAGSSTASGGGVKSIRSDGTQPPSPSLGVWKNEEDRYYYVLTGLLERDETVREAYRARLEANGFTLMEDAHTSALIVDLIDVSEIRLDDVDSSLRSCAEAAKKASVEGRRHFIVNVDKTFSAQIEAVLRSLLLTFGNRIRSANLTGKAAGLTGNRGDVILPSKLLFSKRTFGEDSTDEVRLCNRNNSLSCEDIVPFLGKSSSATVHQSSCITFPGFVLQSTPVLRFYKIVHGCGALETQSSYMARQIEECRRTGVLSETILSRYLFYFDDMPLGNENGLKLKPQKREIISTIYATARSLLSQILAPSGTTLTKRFVEARRPSALEEAKQLLELCQSGDHSRRQEEVVEESTSRCTEDEQPHTGGKSVVTVYLNTVATGCGPEAALTLNMEWLEQHSWMVLRVFDLCCTLHEIAAAATPTGTCATPQLADAAAAELSLPSDTDIELLCIDVRNIACAMVNAKLSSLTSGTVEDVSAFRHLSPLLHVCSTLRKQCGTPKRRWDGSLVERCVREGRVNGMVSSDGCDEIWIQYLDPKTIVAATALLRQNRSLTYASVLFVRTVFRFCSWKQITVVVMLSLCGSSVLYRLQRPFQWDAAVTVGELASRQAHTSATTSFWTFAKNVFLGYPGKLFALSALVETLTTLLMTAKDSVIEGVIAGYKAGVTRDTVTSVSRFDYSPDPSWDVWRRAEDALSVATCADYFEVDSLFHKLFRHVDVAAAALLYPVELMSGWAAAQCIDYTDNQWCRVGYYEKCVEEIEMIVAQTAQPEGDGVDDSDSGMSLSSAEQAAAASTSTAAAAATADGELMTSDSDEITAGSDDVRWACEGDRRLTKNKTHLGLSLLLCVAMATTTSLGADQPSLQSSNGGEGGGTWVRLLLMTRLPSIPRSYSCQMVQKVTLPLCDAAASAKSDGHVWSSDLPREAQRYFVSKAVHIRFLLRQRYEVAHPIQQRDEASVAGPSTWTLPRANKTVEEVYSSSDTKRSNQLLGTQNVYRSLLGSCLDDLRTGGWGVDGTFSSPSEMPLLPGNGTGEQEKPGHQLASLFTSEVPRSLIDLFRSLVPPLVMVGITAFYPSRLHDLNTSEAAAVPQELTDMSDEAPLFPQPWVSMSARSGCECGGKVLRQLTPAMVVVQGSASQDFSAYPVSVNTLEHLCTHKPRIDWRAWEMCDPLPCGPWSIEFRNVSFRYPNSLRFAIQNVSFTVDAGGFLGIIGYSGAGKSTLLLLMSRIYAPTSGAILLNGKPIESFPVRELRRRIGNVWQEANVMRFMDDLTIEGNIALGNLSDATDDTVVSALRDAEAWSFVESRGRGRRGKMNVSELSGGEVERLNIARCMMKDRDRTGVFLFDECTSAMDSLTESIIMTRVNTQAVTVENRAPRGDGPAPAAATTSMTTRIMVSHRLSSLRDADEILVLVDGQIAERGTWECLHATSENVHFHRLFHSQLLEPSCREETPSQS